MKMRKLRQTAGKWALSFGSTAHTDQPSDDPLALIAAGDGDGITPSAAMKRRALALRTIDTTMQCGVFPGVGHSFELSTGMSAQEWPDEAVRFREEHQEP